MNCHARCSVALLVGLAALILPAGFRGVLSAEDKAVETANVKIKEITLAVPATWTQEEPANNLRLAQFKIDPVKGDKEGAELVVSSFGGGGGGVDPNLKRWVNEFQMEGRKAKITKGESKQGVYYVSDLTGIYNKRIGPPIQGKTAPMPGSRALGIILQVPDANVYFLKLTGPEKTVTAAAAAFRASFGGNAEKEEEYEIK